MCLFILIRPKYKISVFRITGLKILGRVGIHHLKKKKKNLEKIFLCILNGILP